MSPSIFMLKIDILSPPQAFFRLFLRPSAESHVNLFLRGKNDPFGLKQSILPVAESQSAVFINHPLPGHMIFIICLMQRISDGPGSMGIPRQPGNLPV